MKPTVIAGANANPGAPRDWDAERDGPCGNLPIKVKHRRDGEALSCESAWELEPGELDLLKAGGRVILYVAGWQVPVALRVEPAPTEAKVEAKENHDG